MRKGWWKQDIFYGEEKMRIGLGTLGAVSFLEDCDMEEGIELVFVDTWMETRTIV